MANDGRSDDRPELNEKLRQEPLSEDDLDRLRREGRSPEIGDDDTPRERVARAGAASAGLRDDERPDEHRERMRAAGRERQGGAPGFELGGKPSKEGLEARGGAPDGRRQDPQGPGADRTRMQDEGGLVAERAHGGDEQVSGHRGLNAREGARPPARLASTGDESEVAQLRADGRGESQPSRTQVEQDYGEQGRRLPDWADNSKAPSINDPDPDRE